MPDHRPWVQEILVRLQDLRLSPEREAEIVEELAQHLEDLFQRSLACGATREEAREVALSELSDVDLLGQELKAVESIRPEPEVLGTPGKSNGLADLWLDLRYALRTLTKTPGFTSVAVLSLALGIGGNAAMFSIVNSVLIRPLPYPDADRLVQAANDGYYPAGGLVALQQRSRTVDLAGFNHAVDLNLTGHGEAWRLTGSSVSANLFSVLGVEAELGRVFQPGEDYAGQDNLAILSHALWQNKFGGDRGIVGQMIALGGVDRQVVGVMPASFAFPDTDTQFWIPLHMDPRDLSAHWATGFMPVMGRLRSGVTLEQARGEIRSLTPAVVKLFPYPMAREFNAEVTLVPLQQYMASNVRAKLIVLQCSAGVVLLIACVNIAGLLLARSTTRKKEIALRLALGAKRGRIVRQLLTESVTISLIGGIAGIALALGAFPLLKLAFPDGLSTVQPGWQLAQFTTLSAAVLSLLTGLSFGLAPALSASREDLAATIRAGGQRTAGAGRTPVQSVLIAVEVALAVVLAVSAGLLMTSLWKLTQVDPGFQSRHILTLRISPGQSLCRERASCIALYNQLVMDTRTIPGVEEVSAANTLPLAPNFPSVPVVVEGHPYVPSERLAPMFWEGAVMPGYFRVMGISLLDGRPLLDTDAAKSAPVLVVSASMARRYWPDENPIGKHVRLVFEDRWRTVVGVAGNVRQYDLANHSPEFIRGDMYMPYAQSVGNDHQLPAAMTLIVRTSGAPTTLPNRIVETVRKINPNVPVSDIRTMDSLVDNATQSSRSMTWLFVGFAAIALALAAIGAYGVVSYSVGQRTFEIGMRVALGATKPKIFSMVLSQSLGLVAAGLVLGVTASLAVTRVLASFLYGTAPTDPVTFLAVCGLLLMVALIAGFVPARRAASVDPLTALRQP